MHKYNEYILKVDWAHLLDCMWYFNCLNGTDLKLSYITYTDSLKNILRLIANFKNKNS